MNSYNFKHSPIFETTLAITLFALFALTPTPARAQGLGPKDVVLKGDAVCTRCHDESEEYPVLAIGKTKHGTVADARTPTCVSCHGESPTHVNKPTNAVERPKPDRVFGKGAATPMDERDRACLDCHQGGRRMQWAGSRHDNSDVGCTSCHQVHTARDRVRIKIDQAEICFDCHKQQRVQISKPSRHPVREGKVACSDCHNPHGSAGPKMMVRDTVNDTCYQCHTEKRGPFLWNHQPVTEDCSICHNPHGTTVANLLKWRPPFLCQQCHEPAGHRGFIASVTVGALDDEGGRPNTLARGCANCHLNIHGSNNPLGADQSRSLRR